MLRGVGALLLLLVGLSLFVTGQGDRYLTPLAVLMVGLGAGGAAQMVLERRWAGHRPGPALARAPSGVPSTLLVRAPWSAALRWGITMTLTVPLAAWVVAALLDRQWFWLVVVLALLAYVVAKLVPRGRPVGLHLTPEHLVLDDHGRERTVAWSQVRDVAPVNQTFLRLHDGSKVHFVAADLAVHPYLACLALQVCVNDPELRAELGTPASLAWPVWRGAW